MIESWALGIILVLLLIAYLGIKCLGRMRKENGGVPQEPSRCPEHTCSGCCGGTSCFNAKEKHTPRIVYFEDEELDRFRSRNGVDYTPSEVAEWQEVLRTLKDNELAPWRRSIGLRRLVMPSEVRNELESRLALQQV